MDSQQWIREKWNPRYSQVSVNQDDGLPNSGGYKWLLRMKTQGGYSYGRATDSGRDWSTPYQDIMVVFDTKCQDAALSPGGTATGHTIKLGETPQTTTYQSGSGTANWVLRIPVLLNADQIITYSYDSAVGNTTAIDDGQEIANVTDIHVSNLLTKRIKFTLKKSDNNPVVSETVKMSVHLYNSGTVENPGDNVTLTYPEGMWMRRVMEIAPTTNSDGLIDIPYTGGVLAVGTTVYIVVYRPNVTPTESFAWVDTIK